MYKFRNVEILKIWFDLVMIFLIFILWFSLSYHEHINNNIMNIIYFTHDEILNLANFRQIKIINFWILAKFNG